MAGLDMEAVGAMGCHLLMGHMVLGSEHLIINLDRLKIRESSPKFQDCLKALIPKHSSGKDAGLSPIRITIFLSRQVRVQSQIEFGIEK